MSLWTSLGSHVVKMKKRNGHTLEDLLLSSEKFKGLFQTVSMNSLKYS